MKTMWKFLNKDGRKIVSAHGDFSWKIGKEYTAEGEIRACSNGFHASEYIQDALGYVQGEVLAIVEGSGKVDKESDKVCFEKMKIVKAYKWTKTDSVTFAIYCAEQVIKIYEDKYPNDSRPRDAIKAAKAYLKDPRKKNRDASYAASDAAAYASDAAAYASSAAYAASAASAAAHAAYAAYAASAASAAAYASDAASAASAASAAAHAASAAYAKLRKKLHRKAKSMVKHLEEIK